MALTRKLLKSMGIEDEKVDQIIEAHAETVDGLKERLEKAEAGAKDLPALQKKLEDAEAALETAKNDGYKDKYEKEHKALTELQASITAKETRAAKETAVKAYLESKGIKGDNLTIALRGMSAEIDGAELDGEKLKDTKALDALISGDFKGLVATTEIKGAQTATPPASNPQKVYTAKEIGMMSPTQINENWDAIKTSLKGAN